MSARVGKSRTLKRTLDPTGLDAMANNLRGLTEEEAERATSQAIVTRYGVTPDTVTDVLDAKKELLRRSGMLEFIDASENLADVGGLDNLKRWLAQRRGTWDDAARDFGLEPPRGVIILGVQGCGKSMCARAIAGEWKLPLVKFDTAAISTSTSARQRREFKKYFASPRDLPLAYSGSTSWRRFLPEAGRTRRRSMRAFPRASWLHSFPGCRTAKHRYSLPPPVTMSPSCHRN